MGSGLCQQTCDGGAERCDDLMSEDPPLGKPHFSWRDIDLRPVDTLQALHLTKTYLEIMEEQMPRLQAIELAALEASFPPVTSEDDHDNKQRRDWTPGAGR